MTQPWTLIESDPAILHELLRSFGVTGCSLAELWDLSALPELQLSVPVHGLCLLFRYAPRAAAAGPPPSSSSLHDAGVIFVRQVVPNACCTIALLHIALNSPGMAPLRGPVLEAFEGFTAGFDADTRGAALEAFDPVRLAHNAFASPEPFIHEQRSGKSEEQSVNPAGLQPCLALLPISGPI